MMKHISIKTTVRLALYSGLILMAGQALSEEKDQGRKPSSIAPRKQLNLNVDPGTLHPDYLQAPGQRVQKSPQVQNHFLVPLTITTDPTLCSGCERPRPFDRKPR